jgi:hypothetical protein
MSIVRLSVAAVLAAAAVGAAHSAEPLDEV